MEIAALLARVIREQREKAGMTQEDVAYESDTSIRHYQKIEAGQVDLRLSRFLAVARALGLRRRPCSTRWRFPQRRGGGSRAAKPAAPPTLPSPEIADRSP